MGFKNARIQAGYTQKEVAKKLGVSRTTVSMWETGSNFPRGALLKAIAELYNCKLEDLLNDKIRT